MRFANKTLIEGASVVADITSEIVPIETIVNFSVQIVWTSTTASATVAVQVSNDDLNWVTLGTATAINNNNGNVMVTVANNPYKSMRVFADFTSGSITTLKCVYNSQGF